MKQKRFFYEDAVKEKSPQSARNNMVKSRSSPRLEANILEKHL